MHTILYVGAEHPTGDPLGLLQLPQARRNDDGSIGVDLPAQDDGARLPLRFVTVGDPQAASTYARSHVIDVLVLDTRLQPFRHATSAITDPNSDHASSNGHDTVESEPGTFADSRVGTVLRRLFPESQTVLTLPRLRILGIVGAGPSGAQAAYELGRQQIGAVVSQPNLDALLQRLSALLQRRLTGKVALCLAGGGIEGALYELGVLRALEAFFVNYSAIDFDFFCGISAGAFLGSFLANGVGPEEIIRGLSEGTSRIDPIRRSDIFDPNLWELGPRMLGLSKELVRGRLWPRSDAASMATLVPGGFFAGDRLREYLKRQLNRPGMSDRFADLRRPLYLGATDQDTSEAVIFCQEQWPNVPVHQAVRASSALIPFYTPEKIGNRYYIDGAFSRTTNMRVAVEQGATLVVLIDPLVPVVTSQSGYVFRAGGVFSAMQGLKSLINGRFNKAVRALREMYPDVSFHLFRPQGEDMRQMAGSPMKFFYQRHLTSIGFQSGIRQIRSSFADIARDFALHGIKLRDPEIDTGPTDISQPRFEPEDLGVD